MRHAYFYFISKMTTKAANLIADLAATLDESVLELLQPLFEHVQTLESHASNLEVQLTRVREQLKRANAASMIQAGIKGKLQRVKLKSQLTFQEQGTRVLNKYVLKRDRFPDCHVLDTENGDIAPNFRRFKDSPFYGGAQPTEKGFHRILDQIAADGFSDVVWINLREEAVIFVKGIPYTARGSAKLNENDLVPGMTGHTIQILEASLKNSLMEQVAENPFEYWYEPSLLVNELACETAAPSDVQTLPEIMSMLSHEKIPHIQYHRLPIDRENFPEQKIVEKLVDLVQNADPETAFLFNCQIGRGRTTTAMVLAHMAWHIQQPECVVLVPDGLPMTRTHRSLTIDPSTIDYSQGTYKVILALCDTIEQGQQSKAWVDATIDECAVLYNIRTVIEESRQKSMEEAKPAKRSFYLHRACRFLERYFYFIVFGEYLLEAQVKSFSSWLQIHPELYRLLDDLGGATYPTSKVLHNNILKFDHFPGLSRLPLTLGPNVPNYRQIGSAPLFGTAQCLEQGIQVVLEHLTHAIGHAQVIWINLREEAVLYVAGKPYAIRKLEDVFTNVEYPGIEVDEIRAIENTLKDELITTVQQANGLFMHLVEPQPMHTEERFEAIIPDTDIRTLEEAYEIAQLHGYNVRYARIPVSDEIAPEEKDLDDLVRLLVPIFTEELSTPIDQTTAIVCNCQMGRGRTTTALVCIYMLRAVVVGDVNLESLDQPKENTAYRTRYTNIDGLVELLENGKESLELVDMAVDATDHIQNLRECIHQCREMTKESGLSSKKQDFFMHRAMNYLERYFYLVCFASYVLEQHQNGFEELFVSWMRTRFSIQFTTNMASHPELKLTYFDMPGRADLIRLVLFLNDIPFEDERITREEFAARKESFPFHQVPTLTINGEVYAQGHSLARYVGSLTNMYPVNQPIAALKVDEILDFQEDIVQTIIPMLREQDPSRKEILAKELSHVKLPKLLELLENRLAKSNGVFILGDTLTIADITLYVLVGTFKLSSMVILCLERKQDFGEMFSLGNSLELCHIHNWFKKNLLTDEEAIDLIDSLLKIPSFKPNINNSRIFRWACLYNHTQAVQLLVYDGRIDIFAQNEFGIRVAIKKNRELVEFLCENHPLLKEKIVDLVQETFIDACHHGQLEAVIYLLNDSRLLAETMHNAITGMTFIDNFCATGMMAWLASHKMTLNDVENVVKLVIDHPKYNIADRDSRIFRWFCVYGDVNTVKNLLKDPRVDPTAKHSVVLFLVAGDNVMMQILLKDGRADPIVAAQNYPRNTIFAE
ncbi:paladin [Thraustotheca clavata]|uniref:Paladin n=1 Tax=Thraustotheca clavata TaxID=74557 RepID=A0A1V9YTE6_9STRA|nr:paladin [Thraustotheca clavata]